MKTAFAVLRATALAMALAACIARTVAQVPDALKRSFFDPNTAPQAGAAQGASVASDGDFVVVGAPLDDTDGYDAGVVKVYQAATGALLHTLANPRPTQLDNFGNAVAISGTRVVVGARGSDVGGEDRGRTYVYDLASAAPTVPILTVNNPDGHIQGDNHNFGYAVAISGTTVVVGATYAQVAYVFDLASATPGVPQLEIPDPTPEVYDGFGAAVAVAGRTVAIGTSISYPVPVGMSPEAAFVYDLAAAEPAVPRLVLRDPRPTPNDGFGEALALDGSHLIVGAPKNSSQAAQAGSAYLFDLASPTPTLPVHTFDQPGAVANAYFGAAVASIGRRVAIGAPRSEEAPSPDAGNAYLYDLDSATPTVPEATLPDPNPSPGARFGAAVALTSARAVVGSPGDDAAASDAGAVFVYTLPIVAPAIPALTLNAPSLEAFHSFGSSVAVSGTLLVVGTQSGIAYVYDLASAMPATPLAILPNPRVGVPDRFGTAVAISGKRIIVGASGDDVHDNDPGRAYIFDLASAAPAVPVLTLLNPSPNDHDDFGHSVAISGTRAVIGAPFDDTSGLEAGQRLRL
jgi:drug/metabolite transporter superfamily protein YnfA